MDKYTDIYIYTHTQSYFPQTVQMFKKGISKSQFKFPISHRFLRAVLEPAYTDW